MLAMVTQTVMRLILMMLAAPPADTSNGLPPPPKESALLPALSVLFGLLVITVAEPFSTAVVVNVAVTS